MTSRSSRRGLRVATVLNAAALTIALFANAAADSTAVGAPAASDAPQVLSGPSRRIPLSAPFPRIRALLWGVLIIAASLLAWMAFRLSKDSPT